MEKLGKLNVRLRDVFIDQKMPDRIFAFVESKYSSKIEGIYTTLFDVVNTGIETDQQKIIKPIVDELFKTKEKITTEKLIELSNIMNNEKNQNKRFEKEFGIYETKNDVKTKIYEPPLEESVVTELFKEVIEKASNDNNILEILRTHIYFEKIHPFVDANGRLGRLLLQRSMARLVNFSNVLPLSWSFFERRSDYYKSFDIETNEDLDNGINALLDIILHMYEATKQLTKDLKKFVEKYIGVVMSTSSKVSEKMALDILLNLQTKRIYVERKYNLNPRTIDSIFTKLNNELPFNFKKVKRNSLYWNIELEEIVNNIYKD